MRWAGHVARMEEKIGVHRVLVWKPLGRPRRRWEDNINLELLEAGCGVMGQDRDSWRVLLNAVMNIRFP
jgi:hypothetical protein